MKVVYLDVLFLINFCMDYLALRTVGGLLHLPLRGLAVFLASALGGIYAITAALFPGNALVATLLSVAVAGLLCFIAYGKECGKRTFCGATVLFFGVSWLLGGMITAFYSMLSQFFEKREALLAALLEGDAKVFLFFLLVFFSVFLLGLVIRYFNFSRKVGSVPITIYEGENSKTVTALVDSGNTLCDPLSGKPCVVLAASAVLEVVPQDILAFARRGHLDPGLLLPKSRQRIRLVPAESLGGTGLFVGYIPTRLVIEEGGKEAHAADVILVLDCRQNEFCGHSALISPDLIS